MITVNEIAKVVNGTVQGDGNVKITGMSSPAYAKEGDLTFAVDEESMAVSAKSKAACVMVAADITTFPKTVLRVKDMKVSLTVLYNALEKMRPPAKGVIHPAAIVDSTAVLGKDVAIGPCAVIGKGTKIGDHSYIGAGSVIGDNVIIGAGTKIYPNVTIYDMMNVGSNVIIHSGAVIGADGFGFLPKDGVMYKVPQMCSVVIEDNVEIGANTCIDRGTFVNTVIGKGTKLDNLVQIAHNVKTGKNVVIAAQTGIAGSSTVGDNVMMGGQVGVADHVKIEKNVKIGAQSGVTVKRVADGAVLFGTLAQDATQWLKKEAFANWLYKNAKKIRELVKEQPGQKTEQE